MKSATPALVNYLANLSENPQDYNGIVVHLFNITLTNGTILYYNDMDRPLTYNGHTYQVFSPTSTNTPVLNRVKSSSEVGLVVSTLELDVYVLPSMNVSGLPFLQAVRNQIFDLAGVVVYRVLMPTWGDLSLVTASPGAPIVFSGYIADIKDVNRGGCKFIIKSWTDILNQMMPRDLYTPACRHVLYGPNCTVNRSSFTVSGAIKAGSTSINLNTNLTASGPIAPPSSAPSISGYTPGGSNAPSETYYAVTTYVTAFGETTQSPVAAFFVGNNGLIIVTAPSSVSGAIGWNVYVGLGYGYSLQATGAFSTSSQTPYFTAPYSLSHSWLMPEFGFVEGPPPPIQNTSGYYTEGTITFTSGVNSGLSYEVVNYTNSGGANGILSLAVPTLGTPSTGDTFTIVPGCDKSYQTCLNKFNNLIHFGGQPWVPTPEAVF